LLMDAFVHNNGFIVNYHAAKIQIKLIGFRNFNQEAVSPRSFLNLLRASLI
jgi:hypothetical protein